MKHLEYCDDETLTNYIWRHYQVFLTQSEGLTSIAFGNNGTAAGQLKPSIADLIRQRWYQENVPQIIEEIKDGNAAFRKRVRDRILQEHGHVVFINRCPDCSKIVKTPRARQCLWCNHDWHQL